jgi:hypothetical protein
MSSHWLLVWRIQCLYIGIDMVMRVVTYWWLQSKLLDAFVLPSTARFWAGSILTLGYNASRLYLWPWASEEFGLLSLQKLVTYWLLLWDI